MKHQEGMAAWPYEHEQDMARLCHLMRELPKWNHRREIAASMLTTARTGKFLSPRQRAFVKQMVDDLARPRKRTRIEVRDAILARRGVRMNEQTYVTDPGLLRQADEIKGYLGEDFGPWRLTPVLAYIEDQAHPWVATAWRVSNGKTTEAFWCIEAAREWARKMRESN